MSQYYESSQLHANSKLDQIFKECFLEKKTQRPEKWRKIGERLEKDKESD